MSGLLTSIGKKIFFREFVFFLFLLTHYHSSSAPQGSGEQPKLVKTRYFINLLKLPNPMQPGLGQAENSASS